VKSQSLPEPNDVLYRIKRGLAGYISYLAACEMNEAFSEYLLYEPILRILTARGYSVLCESACSGIQQPATGDRKKLDFEVTGHGLHFALEVKRARQRRLDVENDYIKLAAFHAHDTTTRSYLCVFGVRSIIEEITLLNGSFNERGKAVYADFGKTRYGCRMYQLKVG
jgi:Holliday junction resolvase